MKTAVFIINYNTPEYTNNLYESLKPYERNDYELFVMDNNSDPGKESHYVNFKSSVNEGYGSALDLTMKLFLEEYDENIYDSLCIMNSDLILHGCNFFKELRKALFSRWDLMIVSPCIIQPEKNQNFFKQMWCWNSKEIRFVKLVDYNCPLIKREFIKKIGSFGSKKGWLQDFLTSIKCSEWGYKLGILDWVPVIHIGNGTVKQNKHLSNYNILAQREADEYFLKNGLVEQVNQLKLESMNYSYTP